MSDALNVYLHDHLAGAGYAIDLLEFMIEKHTGDELGSLAATLLVEVQRDRETLREIAERVGSGRPNIKEAASWLSEKASRIKLGHDRGDGLATFEALEFLALGIQGKLLLWRALQAIAPNDARLAGADFLGLAERAQHQREHVETRRVHAAVTALRPGARA